MDSRRDNRDTRRLLYCFALAVVAGYVTAVMHRLNPPIYRPKKSRVYRW